MMNPDRVLEPLGAAEDAIRRLQVYETPAELDAAVRETAQGVERVLRLLLRADVDAPDEERVLALSPVDLPVDRVIASLRSRDRISLEVAGAATALFQSVERGVIRAADADRALEVVSRLRSEVEGLAERGPAPQPAVAGSSVAPEAPVAEEPVAARQPLLSRRWLFTGIAVVVSLLILAGLIFVLARALDREMDQGIAAFRAGRLDEAVGHFQAVVDDAPDNVTARLYLARIYRRQGDMRAAAEQLQAAVRIAPQDADVRRELGHLLLSLGRTSAAVDQYRRALEIEPDDTPSWVGLIRALRAQGDPAAETLLRQATPEARAILGAPGSAP